MAASIILSDNGVSSGTSGIKPTGGNDGTLQLQTTTSGGTPTAALTIDTSQNVGIGTSSPTNSANYKTLSLNGTTGGQLAFQTGGTLNGSIYNDASGNLNYSPFGYAAFFTAGAERMRIDASGNVGIGTSSPSSYGKFAVVSGATTFSVATDAYTSATFGPRPANDGYCSVLLNYSGTSFNKIDSTTTSLTLIANSKAGLQVFQDGSAALGGGATSTGAWGIVGANNSNAGYPTAAYGGTGVAMAWNFTAGGREVTLMNLDTGAGSGGGFRFVQRTGAATNSYLAHTASNGAWYQGNNSSTWSTTSDLRIKQNVRPLNSALEKITALNPCHFEYKNTPDQIKTGFIAQEFEQVLPGHVHESEPDTLVKQYFEEGEKCKSIDADLIPYLVGAIKELKADLDATKAELAALKGQA